MGRWQDCVELMDDLLRAGCTVSVQPEDERMLPCCDLIISRAVTKEHIERLQGTSTSWLAWCSGGEELQALAYQYGAMAVFPDLTSPEVIMKFIRRFLLERQTATLLSVSNGGSFQRSYARGDIILMETDTVLEVEKGILAQSMVHKDGSEVLLGLMGPGCLVIPHPEDTCFIQLVAHSDALVTVRSWEQATGISHFPERLRCRLQRIEAWAAMQARPHLDQRIIGILSLLAEQFGVPCSEGRIVDVRITHTQLASAVGATRTTITRTLGDLRRQGVLSQVQTAEGERFCLLKWEDVHHGF